MLYDLIERRAAGRRRFERMKIEDHEIDGDNPMFFHLGEMLGMISQSKNSAVNFRMEGFDAAVHHLWEAGELGHVPYWNLVVAQQGSGAAGRNDLNTQL